MQSIVVMQGFATTPFALPSQWQSFDPYELDLKQNSLLQNPQA